MSDNRLSVANVLIQPRMVQRPMSEQDVQAVEELVHQFNQRMGGEHLVCAAQAIGILTADYCQQIREHGGEAMYALQDIAGRGENWIRAGDEAQAVVNKVRRRVTRCKRSKAR